MRRLFEKLILLSAVFLLFSGIKAYASSAEQDDRDLDRQRIIKELVIPGYVEKLKLTTDQKEKFIPVIEELFKKRHVLIKKAKEGGRKNMREIRKNMQALRENTEEKLKTVLTKDQLKKFRELEQKQRESMREKMRKKEDRTEDIVSVFFDKIVVWVCTGKN